MKAYTWRRVPTSCCRCSLPTVPAPSNSRRATRDARRLAYNVRRTSTNVQNAVPRSTARRRTITCGMQSADGAPPNTTATRPKIHPRQSVTQQRLAGLAVLTHEYSRTSVHARVFTHEHSRTSVHARAAIRSDRPLSDRPRLQRRGACRRRGPVFSVPTLTAACTKHDRVKVEASVLDEREGKDWKGRDWNGKAHSSRRQCHCAVAASMLLAPRRAE
jgi:hypothetical protein